MKKTITLCVLILLCFFSEVLAQEREITGKVISGEDASALPGVTVYIKGTSIGTATQVDGTYRIKVPGDSVILVFNSVGMLPQEIKVEASSVLDVKLFPDVAQLKEVVVTALGVEKKARGLTYSTQKVSGEEINKAKEINMINSLAGKAAGVVVTKGASGVGSASKVILRGNKSIAGNNEPLYVIDGVPMSNASGAQATSLYVAFDGGDAISNLNPDDIESISVLKGASAAALYGSQAANGVIMITTKKGKEGISRVDISSMTTFEQAFVLPEIQNTYGQVIKGKSDESWGGKTLGTNTHIEDFFNMGSNLINSIGLTNGNKLGQYYLSYANTNAGGIVPENTLRKHNANFRGTTKMWKDRLSLDAGVNYINQKISGRPFGGYYHNPLVGLYLFPTGDDFSNYKTYETPDAGGNPAQNWPYQTSAGYSSQNPFWIVHRNPNSLHRDRSIATISAQYSMLDWLKIEARINHDRTSDQFEQLLYAGTDPVLTTNNGEYTTQNTLVSQVYSDVLLNLNKTLDSNYILLATLGASNMSNIREERRISSYTDAFGNTIKTGLYYPNNFSMQNLKGNFDKRETQQEGLSRALFATAQLGFRNMLFLDITGRNEWASTLPDLGKRSFFYPSIGLSYILTETTGSGKTLSFAKLRATYSEVGNALPFGISNVNPPYAIATDGSILPRNAIALGELLPERTRSFEAGTDIRFFNNRLTMDFTYYNSRSMDQLFTISAPAGSGTQFYYVNGGEIQNTGFELSMGYKILSGTNFRWETSLNGSKNTNKILELDERLENDQVVITTFTQTKIYQLVVKEGGAYGDMYGTKLEKDASGNIVKDANGNPQVAIGQDHYLGNPNPDLLAGWSNKFSVRNFSFSFLVDSRFGGEVVSMTDALLDSKGLSQKTADDRDQGVTVINGTSFKPEAFYKTVSGINPVSERYVYSATNVRMREMTLGYTFQNVFKKASNITVSMVGRNLFFFMREAPFDPEVSISTGNGLQGLHVFNLPSTRSFGLNLNVSF